MKQVLISEKVFSTVVIQGSDLIVAQQRMREAAHRVLEQWLNGSEHHAIGDGIVFRVVEDRGKFKGIIKEG